MPLSASRLPLSSLRQIFAQATVGSVEACEEQARRIGYPLMIKASEGGGGKGIRRVDSAAALRRAFEQVTAEVPHSPVFMMQLCRQARHIEVQIVGDEEGQAVALNGRDCTTQRRFQKIFEEAPPTQVVPVETMKNIFYFLELNPRLQVEHPVTEGVTGVNLPAAQLQIAMGIPLRCIADVRRLFGKDPDGCQPIDFLKEPYKLSGKHVIA
ncbi:UNVERIFIED_CONTAM: hypothetical protein H355_004512, partial [Colinus virginianus]